MMDPSGIISLTAGASALAWKVWKQCRDCPGQYKDLAEHTKQLANILREVDELMGDETPLELTKSDFLGSVKSCNTVLLDLRSHLDKYKSLGSQQRRLPDRLRWDEQEVKKLHTRISQNVQMLQMSLQRYNASTQVMVVRLLNQVLEELRNGQRKPESVASFAAAKEASEDQVWPDVLKDLEDLGLEEGDANDNRDLIMGMLRKENALDGGSEPELSEPELQEPTIQPPSRMSPRRAPSSGVNSNKSYPSPELDGDTLASETFAVPAFSIQDRLALADRHSASDVRESRTSYSDATSDLNLTIGLHHHHSGASRKFIALFDDVGAKIEAEVKRQPSTLRDDINLAKEYWVKGDWSNTKIRLLRLLAASDTPRFGRADLSPKLITFLLGVACVKSGDLETARLVFTAVLADHYPSNETLGSPNLPSPPSETDNILDESGIAAATWLGDVCMMIDRADDGAYAHAIALDSIRRRDQHLSLLHQRSGSGASSQSETSPIRALNRSALKRVNTPAAAPAKPILEQILACELDLINSKLNNLDDVVDSVMKEEFPHSNSAFEDINIPLASTVVVQQALPPYGGHSTSTYPLIRQYKVATILQPHRRALVDRYSNASQVSDEDLPSRPKISHSPLDTLVPIEDRLTLRSSKASWPLMWNADFSYIAPLYAIEQYYNKTAAPEAHLLCDPKQLPVQNAKEFKPDHTVPKDEAESLAKRLQLWLEASRISYKQFPSELRCRPSPDRSSPWPELAVFSIKFHVVSGTGLLKTKKVGVTFEDLMHWDGTFNERVPAEDASKSVSSLLTSFTKNIKDSAKEMRAEADKRKMEEYQRRLHHADRKEIQRWNR